MLMDTVDAEDMVLQICFLECKAVSDVTVTVTATVTVTVTVAVTVTVTVTVLLAGIDLA